MEIIGALLVSTIAGLSTVLGGLVIFLSLKTIILTDLLLFL